MEMRTTIQTQTQGLTDNEGAKQVARRLFETYDKKKQGTIAKVDTIPMIVEAYKSFNQYLCPNNADIDSYFKVLDRNQDGVISLDDLEALCQKYLCPQIVSSQGGSQINAGQFRPSNLGHPTSTSSFIQGQGTSSYQQQFSTGNY